MSANDILKQFPDGTPIGDWFTDPSVPAADPSFDASAAENLVAKNVRLTKKEGIDYPDSVTTI